MASSFYALRQLFDTAHKHPQKIVLVLDDQAWSYSELIEQIERVASYLHRLNIVRGQIIYQFLERSLEMICGFYGILCAGGAYCALNPTDPHERVVSLLGQIGGQYVLLHEKTRKQFPSTAVPYVVLLDDILLPYIGIEDIGDLPVCEEYGAAYIICTSGTTGRQKAVVHTHKSFSACAAAFIQSDVGMYTLRDQVLQVAASSWILHLTEISVPLVVGGTLVLLRSGGNLDMAYFCRTLVYQQVTTLTIGPAIILALTNYLEMSQQLEVFKFVRNLCTGGDDEPFRLISYYFCYLLILVYLGEPIKPQSWARFISFLSSSNTRVAVQYGTTESNGALACHLFDITDPILSMGYPLPSIKCLLIDEQGQQISNSGKPNEIGQIHIGGPTLFNCYLNDPERTSNMFVTIDNQVFIKTGDLAHYNNRGELVYDGRIDFQIKLRGQRVETVEIENTIIQWSPNKISNCLVTKLPQSDDLLVAYIISNDLKVNTEDIRDYCNKHLRQYMVPSYFIVMDTFPLNSNGKIDRKQLPLPSLQYDVPTNFLRSEDRSISELEEKVHQLWCSTLKVDAVPRHMNCFALGGSSLSLMQMFNYYQFHLTPNKQLNVLDFFLNPTITEHVQLLINSKTKIYVIWSSLHLVQGVTSCAQERLWMDEKVRFNESINGQASIYNELLIYKLTSVTSLSIDRLRQALTFIVSKHEILRTALIYDEDKLIQKVLPISNDLFNLETTYVMNDTHLKEILYNEETNRFLFNLEQGRVFRCHILRQSFHNDDDNNLKQNDIILFNFHHIAVDGSSITIFINDLRQALTKQELSNNKEDNITYLDYAQYERLEDWSSARQYWHSVLATLDNSIGQQNSMIRTGKGCTVAFDLDHDLVINLNHFISQSNFTLFQVGLAAFFAFLFKMSNSQQLDLYTENGSMTYGELLFYAQQLANHLITECTVQPGQIVCQLIERSFEMVIGILGIWMSGGVYAPLNLHDPDTQLNTCIQQTGANVILVHQPTQDQLLSQCLMINVDQIQLRHRNFIASIRSNPMKSTDTVLHHTSVNFDVHLLEIIGTLIMGGQVILLHPNGNLSMITFSETIRRQQVTILNIMSSLLITLVDYLRTANNKECLQTLCCVLCRGEPLMASTIGNIWNFLNEHCRFYNHHGYIESTGPAVQYLIAVNNDDAELLPIGRPLPNVHIYLLDEYFQPVIPSVQTGEIVIGGNI
ncbi:unnamed protein product [Rotaria sp. Silwood2]|nr:unnamed protein product [Rotaria sp. Silwood2]